MTKEFDIKAALSKASRYCMRSEKCKFDIKKYLASYELNSEELDFIIEKLESENFINEERYVKAFINDKFKFNKWGKIKIINELKAKGISCKVVNDNMKVIDNKEYFETLKQLLLQKCKQTKWKDEFHGKASLVRYGLGRGFEYEIIDRVLDNIL